MRAAAGQQNSGIRRPNPGTYWTPDLGQLHIAAGHRPGTQSAQDCQSVRIYASELCPRQDSNLRSRLRRAWHHLALTSANVLLPGPLGHALDTAQVALQMRSKHTNESFPSLRCFYRV